MKRVKNLVSSADSAGKFLKSKGKPIVKESNEDQNDDNSGSMLNQKTFEDFNKGLPNSEDPNLKRTPKPTGNQKKVGRILPAKS
ncbi:MAG: hypothetical protein ABIS36_12455 [Chryseolinea sp.]